MKPTRSRELNEGESDEQDDLTGRISNAVGGDYFRVNHVTTVVPRWDNFTQPLNLSRSNIKWSVTPSRKLTVTFSLVGAKATKEYQVSISFFCSLFPPSFGQFPTDGGGDACQTLTRQGVTRDSAEVELGVVLTDIHGNGSFAVVIGPVPSGTYELGFFGSDGAVPAMLRRGIPPLLRSSKRL